jgi:hypothetical protein
MPPGPLYALLRAFTHRSRPSFKRTLRLASIVAASTAACALQPCRPQDPQEGGLCPDDVTTMVNLVLGILMCVPLLLRIALALLDIRKKVARSP